MNVCVYKLSSPFYSSANETNSAPTATGRKPLYFSSKFGRTAPLNFNSTGAGAVQEFISNRRATAAASAFGIIHSRELHELPLRYGHVLFALNGNMVSNQRSRGEENSHCIEDGAGLQAWKWGAQRREPTWKGPLYKPHQRVRSWTPEVVKCTGGQSPINAHLRTWWSNLFWLRLNLDSFQFHWRTKITVAQHFWVLWHSRLKKLC